MKHRAAFLICPVRNVTQDETDAIAEFVGKQEGAGWTVHWPARDTDQDDPTGYRICADNRAAIEAADEVWVWWNGNSTGSLFDIGIAWAFRKRLVIVSDIDKTKEGKCFENMMLEWQSRSAE